MIEFIKFNTLNKDHITMMDNQQEIIFEDYDGNLHLGRMYADYQGNGSTLYKFLAGNKFYANGLYFALIKRKDA